MSTMSSALAGLLSLAIGMLGSSVSEDASSKHAPTPPQVSDHSALSTNQARAELDKLAVKGRAPKTGYSRAQFGKAWEDNVEVEYGNNRCPTNEDIKKRDLTDVTFVPRTGDCKVKSGTLHDPYSGKTVNYQRNSDERAISIDHIVALSDAWQKGAQRLSAEERLKLANDPRNLIATTHSLNAQKGDGDAATWLPPKKSYRCDYAKSQIEVKAAYALWVTPAEKDALNRQLDTCDQ